MAGVPQDDLTAGCAGNSGGNSGACGAQFTSTGVMTFTFGDIDASKPVEWSYIDPNEPAEGVQVSKGITASSERSRRAHSAECSVSAAVFLLFPFSCVHSAQFALTGQSCTSGTPDTSYVRLQCDPLGSANGCNFVVVIPTPLACKH